MQAFSTYSLLSAVTSNTTGTMVHVARSKTLQAQVTYNTSGTTGSLQVIVEGSMTTASFATISEFTTTGATTGAYFVNITTPVNYVRARSVHGSTLNIATVSLTAATEVR